MESHPDGELSSGGCPGTVEDYSEYTRLGSVGNAWI